MEDNAATIEDRARYFAPITPGNVVDVIPLEGESQVTGFKYAESGSHVVVKGVGVLDEHRDETRRPPLNDLTGETFDEVFQATKDAEKKGAYAALIVGHTTGTPDDEETRPLVGFAKNFRINGKSPNRLIVADMHFNREFFEASVLKNRFPRRSPEISLIDMRIDPIALLGATSPARPLPDILFHKATDREVYMIDRPDKAHYRKETEMPEGSTDLNDQVKKLTERMGKLESMLTKDKKQKDEEEDSKEEKKDDTKEKNQKEGPEDSNEESAKMQKDSSSTERYARLEEENKALRSQVNSMADDLKSMKSRAVASEVDSKVRYLKSQGVMFGNEDDEKATRERLAKLDEDQRQAEYDNIEKFWRRAPVGVSIDRTGVENTPPGNQARGDYADEVLLRAEQYRKDHPEVSLSEAMTKVNGVAI